MTVRPVGGGGPAAVLASLAGAFFVIAGSTGSGWLIVLGCLLAASLVVGTVWPAVAVSTARVAVTALADAQVGRPVALVVSVERPGWGTEVRLVDPPGDRATVDGPGSGELLATPARRGVLTDVVVEVSSAAPLGIVGWRRRARLPLAVPVAVAPSPSEESLRDVLAAGEVPADATRLAGNGSEATRGVREYMPGDPIRLVHWPATARWGDLMVRELEHPDAPQVVLVVDLRGPAAAAETTASRAAGLPGAALDAGLRVVLWTAEAGGQVTAPVGGRRDAGRRLALAVAGPLPEGPVPPGALLVRVAAEPGGGR